jgi:hypothetical protein
MAYLCSYNAINSESSFLKLSKFKNLIALMADLRIIIEGAAQCAAPSMFESSSDPVR